MRFVFWNLNRRKLEPLVRDLVREHQVDAVVVCESPSDTSSTLALLNDGERQPYGASLGYLPRQLQMFFRLSADRVDPVRDAGGISIRHVRPVLGPSLLLVAVHLRSRLHQEGQDQALSATRVRRMVEDAEALVGHARTVVVGDFNMNPFDPGLVAAETMHAVSTRSVANRRSRVVEGEPRAFFYNPMWGCFGDGSPGPAGTYYYSSSNQVAHFWHMFDQVLLRPAMLPFFNNQDLTILTTIAGSSLLNRSGNPDTAVASDHLPILFDLHVESVTHD